MKNNLPSGKSDVHFYFLCILCCSCIYQKTVTRTKISHRLFWQQPKKGLQRHLKVQSMTSDTLNVSTGDTFRWWNSSLINTCSRKVGDESSRYEILNPMLEISHRIDYTWGNILLKCSNESDTCNVVHWAALWIYSYDIQEQKQKMGKAK